MTSLMLHRCRTGFISLQRKHAVKNGSTRRVDILAYNADTKQGIIVDPTIRFEVECHQLVEVHFEKKSIYEPTINYFKLKYALIHVEHDVIVVHRSGEIRNTPRKYIKRREQGEKSSLQRLTRLQWRYTSTDGIMCSEMSDGVLKRVFVREGDILNICSRQLTISLPSLKQTGPLGVKSNGDRYGRSRVATGPENMQAIVSGLSRRQSLWFVYMLDSKHTTHNVYGRQLSLVLSCTMTLGRKQIESQQKLYLWSAQRQVFNINIAAADDYIKLIHLQSTQIRHR
ncbi:hypothetical protein ANN_03637 [Periplaneta americana]|uniref:Uncharacterized protein n=1 Tax=Periplaneta americana TaxID=6978 RepID=A0ABQ8U3X6_PERAM|nr:hypothetical protein ANN_03637 [Periplaneta americana]